MDEISKGQWISTGLMVSAGFITLSIWVKLILDGFRDRNVVALTRSATALSSMLIWILVVFILNWSAEANSPLYSLSLNLGYIVVLFTLICVWRVLWLQLAPYFQDILKSPRLIVSFTLTFLLYSVFYLFASGMLVFPPKNERLHESFINLYTSYSLLTEWPSLSFGLHQVNLAGTITLDALLLLITISFFMAANIILLSTSWRNIKGTKRKLAGSAAGSTAAITLSSFSCCSLPLLYPLLTVLAGSTAAQSLSYQMIHESGVLFNLFQMMILSLVTITSIGLAKRLGQCRI
jgi:hypothetical protein